MKINVGISYRITAVRTQNIRSLTNIRVKISRMFHCVLFYVITPACDLAVLIIIIIIITIIIWQLGLFLLVLYCLNRSKYRCHGHLSLNVIAIFNFLLDINNRLTMDKPATSCRLTVLSFEPVHLHNNFQTQ